MNHMAIYSRPTATGAAFNYAEVTPATISFRDLVHHMSRRECWGGNTDFASYTLAQHAMVTASACALPRSRIYALLASAPAAYLGWIDPSLRLWLTTNGTDILGLEHRIFNAAVDHFGVPRLEDKSPEWRDVDSAQLRTEATEWRDVVKGKAGDWAPLGKPLPARIKFKPQPKVEEDFAVALERELLPYLRAGFQN